MWYSGAPQAATRTVEYVSAPQPVLPTRRVVAAQPTYFNVSMFRIFGGVLALLAAASLALGIADVILTIQTYCSPWNAGAPLWCTSSGEPYIWVWVASSIWGSIPIFLCGLFAMCVGNNPYTWTRVFALLCFLSAIVFAPAIIVLTAVEAWRGSASTYTFYSYNSGQLSPGLIVPTSSNPYQSKFGIPIAIIVLACIEFIMTAIITLSLCCCMHCLGIYMPNEISAFQGGYATTVSAPVQVSAPAAVAATTTQIVPRGGPSLASNTQYSNQMFYPPRPQIKSSAFSYNNFDGEGPYSGSSGLPYPPTRWYGASNPYGSGPMFGNVAPRGVGGGSFGQQFMQDNGASFWQ